MADGITTTKKLPLIDCPACGKSIELYTTYDVDLGDIDGPASAKVAEATATLTMVGVRVHHQCPPLSVVTGTLTGPITNPNGRLTQ